MNPRANKARRALPFVVEFVKFAAGFVFILAVALFALHFLTVQLSTFQPANAALP